MKTINTTTGMKLGGEFNLKIPYKILIAIFTTLLLHGCSTVRAPVLDISTYSPSNKNSELGTKICSILNKKPHWKAAVKKVEKRWRVPPHVLLSIINQESSFKYNARPITKSGKRLSSAYGFSQALNRNMETL